MTSVNDIAYLRGRIVLAIQSTVCEKEIGVAFSGGVDSSLVAKLCVDAGYDVTLLTIGFSGSHDTEFAKSVNKEYGFKHHTLEITPNSLRRAFVHVNKHMKNGDNISWIENAIAFCHISALASDMGITTVVTANGIDELFCGYDAYRTAFDANDKRGLDDAAINETISRMMDEKIDNEIRMMHEIQGIIPRNVAFAQPLLTSKFIKYARQIPVEQKIRGKDDMMRKHIIRRLAAQCSVPEIACKKRKKAMQYGSKIHKNLLKIK